MNGTDKIEILLIGATAVIALAVSPWLPTQMAAGEIALTASALLLAQGLTRDLWLKYRPKTQAVSCAISPHPDTEAITDDFQPATCMCMESSLGLLGIVVGVLALFSGASHTIKLPWFFWALIILIVGMAGFSMKSLVIDWKAKRIRREADHAKVRFRK